MSQFIDKLLGDVTLPDFSFMNLVTFIATFFIVFGGVIPYIPQYREIKNSLNCEGFSTFVCLTLLIANTLRILFWFGHPFETPLLLQSIVMIGTMLAMVHICTLVRVKNELIASKPKLFADSQTYQRTPSFEQRISRFRDLDRRYFWRWTDFGSYVQFLLLFTFIVGVITYVLMDSVLYVETLGFLAVLFEALLGAPQFYRNYQNSSTQGMSLQMVIMWMTGDVFKTIYFLLRSAPAQFWVCGILQVGLDVAILAQVAVYSKRPHIK